MGVAPLDKGLSRSDWGLRWEGPTGPHRSVSEVSGRETEAVKVPAQRSGAACPTGAVTAGDWGWTDRISERAIQGRTGASARFPAREPKQWRCRRSEAEPHAPPGLSPQVTGGGLTGFLKGPFRAAQERHRGFLQGNRSSEGAGAAKRSRMPHRGCHRR